MEMYAKKAARIQERDAERFWDDWGGASVDEALGQLQASDIRVTNESDKPEQTKRLEKLTEHVMEYHRICLSRREEQASSVA